MRSADVIIVGGGPAGSSCAWRLRQLGIDCLILDKENFPRPKLCAGWITPQVLEDLELDSADYPHRFMSFGKLLFHFRFAGLRPRTVQHSIRRYEFDDWLLKRSGAAVETHEVRSVHKEGDDYVIDEKYRCRYLVGAGGTRCPVYRNLFRAANPRAKKKQVVTLEQEFPYDYRDERCHLWFFDHGLPGYSWYVPKADGYINIGIGAFATRLKQQGDDIKTHWDRLTQKLERKKLVQGHTYTQKGYSYYVRGKQQVCCIDNAFITGDAAGLATRDMAEGIGPAVRSGLLAAAAIAQGTPCNFSSIGRKSFETRQLLLSALLPRPYRPGTQHKNTL
ncbi:MAG: NAD(P)/FAD-dependent oxidoreductase [Thiogranum sp.]